MSHSNRNALYSFLRVLAVALASAILPFLTGPDDDIPLRAIAYALVSAFLLTVVNYFRPGEPRFGPAAGARDTGTTDLSFLGLLLIIVGVVWIVVALISAVTTYVPGVVVLLVGLLLYVLPALRR